MVLLVNNQNKRKMQIKMEELSGKHLPVPSCPLLVRALLILCLAKAEGFFSPPLYPAYKHPETAYSLIFITREV